ncbi:uncharacterized protein LOC111032289 [Myzus persicae]|uniref:uncharacterized protein LOC111032289 n=1 Tax=Myzus persicae TaxID=13164 RepID=UPI000B935130|nr:uncharacterized protein LOC111032289 [Myzus persicae]
MSQNNKNKITTFFTRTLNIEPSNNLKRKHEHVNQSENETIQNNLECAVNVVPSVPKNDIGLFISRSLSDVEKHIVLTNLWSPPLNYLYPLLEQHTKRKIKFQHHWLGKFNWLCYSEQLQGAFCKYCAVFARSGGVGNQTLSSLVTTACQNWKNALKVVEKLLAY